MYYRIAMYNDSKALLQWKSSILTALDALFQFLRIHASLPQDSLRVFTAHNRDELNEMLAQENNAVALYSLTAEQFLQAKGISLRASRHKEEAHQEQAPSASWAAHAVVPAALPPLVYAAPALTQPGGEGSKLERRRLEIEQGPGGDHDVPYVFSLPISMPQTLAWIRLLAKVQRGELEP